MAGHKDLAELRHLPRSALLSYLQKQMQPKAPAGTPVREAARRIGIAAFLPTRLWNWVTECLEHRIGRRHRFQTYRKGQADNGIHKMPAEDEIRIALAGDWATGTDEAAEVAGLMAHFDPHYSIHLGDVYYVGDADEVDENFLGKKTSNYEACRWPRGSHGAFALNGNHEMYSLGKAYFCKMLPVLGPVVQGQAAGQGASFFCLENDHWRLIAIDTGYNSIGLPVLEWLWRPDCSLPPDLMDWVRNTVKPTRDDARGVVILSHHQYFSRYDDWYPKPAMQLAEFFSRPVLWFWGHEHRMAIYRKFGVTGGLSAYGRCIGHGGMPVELPSETLHEECLVDFVDKRLYPNDENLHIGYNGFARISLQQERLKAEYVDVKGELIYSETWATHDGTLTQLAAGPTPPQDLAS